MRSLRTTLALGTSLGIASVLAAAGALLFTAVSGTLLEQLDGSLLKEAALLGATVEVGGERLHFDFQELNMIDFGRETSTAYLQLLTKQREPLYRSESLGERSLPCDRTDPDGPIFETTDLPDAGRLRVVHFPFSPRSDEEEGGAAPIGDEEEDEASESIDWSERAGERLLLSLARPTEAIDSLLRSLKRWLLAGGAATIAISTGLLWSVIRRALAPVDRLASRISEIHSENLAHRFDSGGAPAELLPVVRRLNELLARLQVAIERERAFSADIAHELRTPLAGLRSTLEVAASRTRDPAEYGEAIHDSLQIADHMQAMVEKLLCLARLETGQYPLEPIRVDLADTIRRSWRPFERAAARRGLRVSQKLPDDATVSTDPVLIELAIRNVLENAVVHADDGGSIEVGLTAGAGRVELAVTNSGSKVSKEDVRTITDRFARGDAARTDANVHAGLGLSLVARVATELGAELAIDSDRGGAFVVRLAVPA